MNTRKTKSPEVERLINVLETLGETPESIEAMTGISARTINNVIWYDQKIGALLLRALAESFDVSVDWLLTGRGDMLFDRPLDEPVKRLLPTLKTLDKTAVCDVWLEAAWFVEQMLMDAQAKPGIDYSVMELFKLSQPFALSAFQSGDAKINPLGL